MSLECLVAQSSEPTKFIFDLSLVMQLATRVYFSYLLEGVFYSDSVVWSHWTRCSVCLFVERKPAPDVTYVVSSVHSKILWMDIQYRGCAPNFWRDYTYTTYLCQPCVLTLWHRFSTLIWFYTSFLVKVMQSRYSPGVAQRVPGS